MKIAILQAESLQGDRPFEFLEFLKIGTRPAATLANSPNLSFSNGRIVYDTIDTPLGEDGSTITATLSVADFLGNTTEFSWDFRLAIATKTSDNIFVFGSLTAQRAGQSLGARGREIANETGGLARSPAGAGADHSWQLVEIAPDRMAIDYSTDQPSFEIGQLVTNACPLNVEDIFYREIVSIENNTIEKQITLSTKDVSLTRFIEDGSISSTRESRIFEVKPGVGLVPASARSFDLTIGELGADFKDAVFTQGNFSLSFDSFHFKIEPSLHFEIEIEGNRLFDFRARSALSYDFSLAPRLAYSASLGSSFRQDIYDEGRVVLIGFIGFVPIWVDLDFSVELYGGGTASATAEVSGGFHRSGTVSNEVRYIRSAGTSEPALAFYPKFSPMSQNDFDYNISGELSAEVGVLPLLNISLMSLAGVDLELDSKFGMTGQATSEGGTLLSSAWELVGEMELVAGFQLEFTEIDSGWDKLRAPLFKNRWCEGFPEGDFPDIIFDLEPENFGNGEDLAIWLGEALPGGEECEPYYFDGGLFAVVDDAIVLTEPAQPITVRLQTAACSSSQTSYQWYFEGMPIPGANQEIYLIEDLVWDDSGYYAGAGKYFVEAIGGTRRERSKSIEITPYREVDGDNTGMSRK